MTEILIIMFSGIITGFIFRRKRKLITAADRLAGWSVYLLLFLLGLSTGSNRVITENFFRIGFNSLMISMSAIAGSILFSFILYRLLFREKVSQ